MEGIPPLGGCWYANNSLETDHGRLKQPGSALRRHRVGLGLVDVVALSWTRRRPLPDPKPKQALEPEQALSGAYFATMMNGMSVGNVPAAPRVRGVLHNRSIVVIPHRNGVQPRVLGLGRADQ